MIRWKHSYFAKRIIKIFNLNENTEQENALIGELIHFLHSKRFISVIEFEDCELNGPVKEITYKELLLDHRWKEKSANIKFRDNYKCRLCGSKNNLNVHHSVYSEKFPWDEPDINLITLCKRCHTKFHKE